MPDSWATKPRAWLRNLQCAVPPRGALFRPVIEHRCPSPRASSGAAGRKYGRNSSFAYSTLGAGIRRTRADLFSVSSAFALFMAGTARRRGIKPQRRAAPVHARHLTAIRGGGDNPRQPPFAQLYCAATLKLGLYGIAHLAGHRRGIRRVSAVQFRRDSGIPRSYNIPCQLG